MRNRRRRAFWLTAIASVVLAVPVAGLAERDRGSRGGGQRGGQGGGGDGGQARGRSGGQPSQARQSNRHQARSSDSRSSRQRAAPSSRDSSRRGSRGGDTRSTGSRDGSGRGDGSYYAGGSGKGQRSYYNGGSGNGGSSWKGKGSYQGGSSWKSKGYHHGGSSWSGKGYYHGGGYPKYSYRYGYYYPRYGYRVYSAPKYAFSISFGGVGYYYDYGVWYSPYRWGGYVVAAAPYGAVVGVLPPYYTTVWVHDVPYYYANATYYRWSPPDDGYIVVSNPGVATPEPDPVGSGELFVYPNAGQSEEQQADDRYACHSWAMDQTGYDPSRDGPSDGEYADEQRDDYDRAMTACLEGRDYTVK